MEGCAVTRPKYRQHPLMLLAGNMRFDPRDVMNALQEGPLRLISDNAVTVHDVAECDALEVMRHVKAPWARKFQ